MIRCFIILLFCAFVCKAQPPSKYYAKYGGAGIDIGYGIKETFDRQYIVIGSTTSYGAGTTDAILMLIDSMGNLVWQKTFGGTLADVGKKIVLNQQDSGFVFVGYTNSYGNGGYDLWVVRTDKNGMLLWQKTFGGLDWDFGNDIEIGTNNDIYVCGTTYNSKYGKTDGYALRLNLINGNLVWEKKIGGNEDDEFNGLEILNDGNLLFVGKTNSYNDINGDCYAFKTTLNGDSIWAKFEGGNLLDYFNDVIQQTTTNDLIFTGSSESYSVGKKDAYLYRTDDSFNFIWRQNYGIATEDEEGHRLATAGSNYNFGKFVFIHSTREQVGFKTDCKNFLFGDLGFYQGGGSIGFLEDEESFDITETSDKGFVSIGFTTSLNAKDKDVFLIKMDSTLIGITNEVIGLKKNNRENNFFIYPTLVDEIINLTLGSENKNIIFEAIDIYGKSVYRTELSGDKKNYNIDLSHLSKGVYFIILEGAFKSERFKIIKK